MREVTGYYHMSAWRFRSSTHSIVVIAPERTQAASVVEKFLTSHGYYGHNVESIASKLRPVRNISSNATVIVADFYKE